MDPAPEHSAEEIRDDCSQPSYREEEPLSEASDVSLPSRRRHWMDTRLRTRMRAGGSRLHYQQFDYSSSYSESSRSDDLLSDARDHSQAEPPALFEASMPPDEQPRSFEPANDYELPFLSESEVIPEVPQSQDIPVATEEAEVSLAGTSAPLLTNPTLTDVPISIPQLPNGTSNLQNTETRDTELSNTNEPTARNNVPSTRGRGRSRAALSHCSTRATNSRSQNVSVRAQRTPSRRGRPRGRPPWRPRGRTISSRQTAREIDTQPSITSDSDSDGPTAQLTSDVDQGATQVNPHYGLRRNRVPRYRCGTCGFRDCTCVMALNKSPPIPLGPVKAPVDPKPQPFIHNGKLLVSRVVIRAEKTYTGLERECIFPVDVVLEELSKSKIAEEPCPRFKEWTSDLRGLEFTLAVTVPPVTPNIVFGPFNYEREPIQMVTADLLSDKYGITCQPGEVYCPAQYWWLLVTAPHAHSLVQPDSLRSCLESLRTVVTEELILCFHIVDLYRGKLRFRWWLELIITLFASFPRIRLLDDWTHSFTEPVTIHTALGTLDSWSTANVGNQSLSRSVWQDLSAIRGQNL